MAKYSPDSNGNIAVTVLLSVALVASLGFGVWSFIGKMDYKNNVDKKIAVAVRASNAAQAVTLQKQFDEKEKSPFKEYKGTDTYGSITFSYPKTWSAYVDTSNTAQPINGYFYPNVVPGILSASSVFSLRVELISSTYAQSITQYSGQIKNGKVIASAFTPPKLAGVANIQPGTRFDGTISPNQQGSMVIIKVRDKTLRISSESTDFTNDYNNVLASLTFVP